MKITVIGLGWFGAEFARQLRDVHEITGTKTTAEGASALCAEGIDAVHLSLNPEWSASASVTEKLTSADVAVINIPPPRGTADAPAFYARQSEAICRRLNAGNAKHVVFISSTGVFGANQLRCDEDTVPAPSRGAGRILLDAERYFSAHFAGRVSVIRPGGLCGEDRFPGRFLAGRRDVAGRLHPVNLVHRTDLIALTRAVAEGEFDRRIFHAVAREHPNKEEFYTRAALALGLAPPVFDPADDSEGKYISAEKSKQATGAAFRYDDPFAMLADVR